jgi:hypothetical protein
MDGKVATEIAERHAESSGLQLLRLEPHLLEFNHWMYWATATDGTRWFIAVDDLDGQVLMSQAKVGNDATP